ncbi:MAG: bifunctional phosphoglucose/phosphomannose isomerase [Actinomycetota bacterium]|nr:bifunctional phosphoglucose/phosphomannose isomerase [Actinomycetota bacterium]
MTHRIDSLGMQEATFALPNQIEQSMVGSIEIDGLPNSNDIDQVLVLGMGGSGIAGDIVEAIAAPRMSVPVIVSKGYDCPSFVSRRTLVMAVSFSGETEETLHAASIAHDQGARIVAVTCGGSLAEMARQWKASLHLVDSTIPMPRCAVGAISVPLLMALESIGLLSGIETDIWACVETLQNRCESIRTGQNTPREAAQKIGDDIPVIYGGGRLGVVAAVRLKNQINENAKTPAFFNAMPEICHNEIAGWGATGDASHQNISTVHLRHDFENPRLAPRFEFDEAVAASGQRKVTTIRAQGENPLAQLFDLILSGDQMSLELADLHGQDPGPIDVLTELKHRLSE